MKKFLIISLVTAATLVPAVVFAQNGFVALSNGQSSPLLQSAYTSSSLPDYFNALFRIALSVGAIIAVFQIVRAGYLYMLKDSVSTKQNAREIFGDAVIGLLILLSVWIVLDVINPCILNLSILSDFSSTQSAACSTQ